jgi:hypothetical protein
MLSVVVRFGFQALAAVVAIVWLMITRPQIADDGVWLKRSRAGTDRVRPRLPAD